MLAALHVRAGDKDKPVDRALYACLDRLAALAVFVNPDPLAVKTIVHDKTEVKYLHGEKSAAIGVQPAYALKDGYLLLASAPDALRKFTNAAAVPDTSADCPLLRLSFRALRNYLTARADALVPFLAAKHQVPNEEAKRRLQGFVDFCQFFDRLELSRRTGPGQVALVLRLKTEQALAK